MKSPSKKSINVRNKQARDYAFKDMYLAGLAMTGGEVKLAKRNQVNLAGSHVKMIGREAWLVGATFGTTFVSGESSGGIQPRQKLLLTKRELLALVQASMQKLSIIPVRLVSRHGYVKVEIGVGKINKQYDKRQELKRREMKRNVGHV